MIGNREQAEVYILDVPIDEWPAGVDRCRTRFSEEYQALTTCVPRMSTRHI
jgi:hypothetical protein